MLGSPPDIDNDAVAAAIREVDGVHDVQLTFICGRWKRTTRGLPCRDAARWRVGRKDQSGSESAPSPKSSASSTPLSEWRIGECTRWAQLYGHERQIMIEVILIYLGLGIAAVTLASILWSIAFPARRIWPPKRYVDHTNSGLGANVFVVWHSDHAWRLGLG